MAKYKGTELTTMNGLFAQLSEGGERYTLFFTTKDGEGSGTMNLYLKGFDEKSKKYVDNEEVLNKTIETLKDFGTDLDNLPTDIMSIEKDLYFDGERVSTQPIKGFVTFDKIQTRDGKDFSKDSKEVELNLITDYKGLRFNVGFEYETLDDKNEPVVKTYRVSQFIKENDDPTKDDENISLKYQSHKLQALTDQIYAHRDDSKVLPEKVYKKVEEIWNETIEEDRKTKSDEILNKFGIDLDEWVQNPELYSVIAEVKGQSIDTTNGKTYFLVAEIKDVRKSE